MTHLENTCFAFGEFGHHNCIFYGIITVCALIYNYNTVN